MDANGEPGTLRLERVLACTPDELWDAWTQPQHLAKWFGPMEADNVIDELDVRPGGRFRMAMVGPQGARHPIWGTYVTVDRPRELVFKAEANEIEGHVSTVRVRFDAVPEGTRMRLDQSGLPEAVVTETGAGWLASFQKLDLQSLAHRQIVLRRLVAAPRGTVFKAWTDRNQVDAWWGPDGFRNQTHTMDVRPGGQWRFVMHGPDGTDYENVVTYQEIDVPSRLRYLHGSPEDPEQFRVWVDFDEVEGGTRVTMRSVFRTEAALEEVRKFGAEELGKQTLGRLARHVAASPHADA